MRYLPAVPFLALFACNNPAPECAPRGEVYTVCSDDQVWTCPDGPADVVAANLATDEACNDEADPVQCIFDAEYQFVAMTLSEDCAGAGQVCVESTPPAPQAGTCEEP